MSKPRQRSVAASFLYLIPVKRERRGSLGLCHGIHTNGVSRHGQRAEATRRAVSRYVERHLLRREENPGRAAKDGESRTERGAPRRIRETQGRNRRSD